MKLSEHKIAFLQLPPVPIYMTILTHAQELISLLKSINHINFVNVLFFQNYPSIIGTL